MKKISLFLLTFILLSFATTGRAQQWVVRASSRLEEVGKMYIMVNPNIGRALQEGSLAAMRAAQVGSQNYMLHLKVGEAIKKYVPARVSVNLRKQGLIEIKSFPGLIADFAKEWPLFLRRSGYAEGSPEVLLEARFSPAILKGKVTFEGRFLNTFSEIHQWLRSGKLAKPTEVHEAFIQVRQQAYQKNHGFFTVAVGDSEGNLLDILMFDLKTAKFISLADSRRALSRATSDSGPNPVSSSAAPQPTQAENPGL